MDASTLDKIRAALATPDMAALSDVDAAAALSARTVVNPLVPRWRIKQYLYEQMVYPKIAAAQASSNADVASLAITALAYLNDGDFANLDMTAQGTLTILDGLVAAALATPEQKAAILAMQGTVPEFGRIDEGDVHAIRAGENI
jgi:hypothetical protein